jgi:hypothetical protein
MATIEEQIVANAGTVVEGLNLYKDALEEMNVTVGIEAESADGDLLIYPRLTEASRLMSQTDETARPYFLFYENENCYNKHYRVKTQFWGIAQ